MSTLYFVRLSPHAYAPERGSALAAGFDLRAPREVLIPPHSRMLIFTDLQLVIPEGCYGRIAPRSGLALHHSLDIAAGVIDRDYRGNVGVVLVNNGVLPYFVKAGDRIAQLICEKIHYPCLTELTSLAALGLADDPTERGAQGFGSTGLN
ncbi:E4 ORFA [Tree shrew adenovirus 1]|uniref:E4 ORFA n=1 Tax=Tree shrew adenovirus serotype 1 TaxID=47680 RepID=UPI00001D9797|nr:E4 ORFA [Tree shrew adenovirus 1]